MYLCLDCENIFDAPKSYVETIECDECGQWITGDYIKLNDGTVICDNCYEPKNILGD